MNNRHRILIGVLMLAAVAAGYSLGRILQSGSPPAPGPAAGPGDPDEWIGRRRPAFSLPDLNGQIRSIEEWDGRVLLINFWATWCAPCREEIPAFIRLREQLGEQDFEIIGVAVERPGPVREFVRELSIPYPILHGESRAVEIGERYGNHRGTLPYSVFIGRGGRIRHTHARGVLSHSELLGIITPLLDEPAENSPK